VLSTLSVILPAAIVVVAGYVAGRRMLDASSVKALSDLVFMLFLPCLLFRSLATARFDGSDATMLGVYFGVALFWFVVVVLFTQSRPNETTSGAVVFGLGAVFSNSVQLGIPIQKLAYGEAGLKLQLSIIAIHSLILLTSATVWLEIARARESSESRSFGSNVLHVVKTSIVHPVILPILAGLLWSFAQLPLPTWFDQPLGFLASAAGPIMLVLMGAQLSTMKLTDHWQRGLTLTIAKNLVHPALVFLAAWAFNLSPLATAVAVTCAALPIGANVFMFAQRYSVNENVATAATALSSLVSLVSLTVVMALLPKP